MKGYFDIAGDGGSDILGQVAARHEEIARRLAGVRHMLAIGSGKGGVGKSTLTLQLAQAFRERGARVSILDADFNGPSQARLAGLTGAPLVPGPRGLTVPVNASGIGVVSLGSLIPETRSLEFGSVAAGDSHVWRATREFAALSELLACVEWGTLDLLLVDLPPGADRSFQYAEFFGPRAAFVLVTIPSQLSRGVVARSVAALRKAPNPLLGYIENMKGYHCRDCHAVRPLFPETPGIDLGIPCLGSLPFDPDLAARSDSGEPPAGDPGGGTDVPGGPAPANLAREATRAIAGNLWSLLENRS
jgi:ATP-binding protein involved in chromosome partitioning